MIKPTVGRMVWFYHKGEHVNLYQPQAAQVAYVHEDKDSKLVNLSVLTPDGDAFPRMKVSLIQEGETPPEGEFCCWMPFQQSQAKSPSSDKLIERIQALENELASLKSSVSKSLSDLAKPAVSTSPPPPVQPAVAPTAYSPPK
jgi:hypothetical protein